MIEINLDGVATVSANLQVYPLKLNRAMVRAINRSIGSVRTVMVRAIASDVGLKQKDVRSALSFRKAAIERPEAAIGAKLKRIPLIEFKATGPEPSRGKGRGVAYKLSGATSRNPHAFIATMPSGHRGVFIRKAKERLGIQELFGPSLGRVFGKYRELGIARGREVLVSNLQHEMEFAGAEGSVEVTDDAGTD